MRVKILAYVTDFSRENGYPPTVREICEAVGLRSPSTVHSHLKILQEGGLLTKDDRKTRALKVPGAVQFGGVPMLGKVTAGAPILAQQELTRYIPYEGNTEGLFALEVRGDSMINAAILDGDIVVVRRQQHAESGQIVVALLGDEATVKRLRLKGGAVWLMPENPDYDPIDGTDCVILGRVVAVYRPDVV
jgi:repressor LexA